MTRNQIIAMVTCASALIYSGCRPARELEPTPPEDSARVQHPLRPPVDFQDVPTTNAALRQAVLFTRPLSVPGVIVEIRTILIRPQENAVLVAENEGIVELRSGHVFTTIDGQKKERTEGDMWQVKKGSRQQFQVLGELASARAIYLVPARR